MATKKLGKNLQALLGEKNVNVVKANPSHLPIDCLRAGKFQPRITFKQDTLQELADSIKQRGIIQPIVVRPLTENNRYEIIAGERRWRAAQLAGLTKVPVSIRNSSDEEALAIALIENLQRDDLNPIEEAHALQRLQQEFSLTQLQLADAVGKSRSAVTNSLRLMNLTTKVKTLLMEGQIEMGHARALLSLDEKTQITVANQIIQKNWSVRATEQFIQTLKAQPKIKIVTRQDPNVLNMENTLSDRLAAKVSVHCNQKGKGKVIVSFNSLEEFEGILERIH